MAERPSLRQLEYFLALDRTRNFREAAEACFVTQPALSAQIAQLEQRLGVQLFERDHRGVRPTPAGRALVGPAREVMERVDLLADRAHTFTAPLEGELRLGVIPTVAPYLLPPILPALRAAHPKLRLVLREEKTDVLVAHLHEGELDVLLLALEADLRDCESVPLFSDPFLVALPASHALASRETITLDDLKDEPLLLLEEGHCLREQSLPVCDAAGGREVEGYRASSLGTLVQMVAGGLGLTFVPEIAAPLESRLAGEIVLRPLAPAEHSRTIALAWRSTSARGDEFRELGASISKAYAEM